MKFGISYDNKTQEVELQFDQFSCKLTRGAFFKIMESFVFVGQGIVETVRESDAVEKARMVVENYLAKKTQE